MREKLLIIGTSTTARHVYDFVTEYDLYEIIGFAVDSEYKETEEFCDLPVYTIEDLDEIVDKDCCKLFVAILWNHLNADRRQLFEKLRRRGYRFANLISPTAKIRGKIEGDNCWIHDYVIIQSEAKVKEDCMLMAFSLVGDYSVLGAHCFMGTKSTLAGKCEVGEQTFIGINCTVFDGTVVGKMCILGACTVVKRNLPDYTIVKSSQNNVSIVQENEENIRNKLVFSKNVR